MKKLFAALLLGLLLLGAFTPLNADPAQQERQSLDQAKNLFNQGDIQQAETLLKEIMKQFSGEGAYFQLGDFYENTGKLSDAKAVYQEMVKLFPTQDGALSRLIEIDFKTADFAQIPKLCEQLISLMPDRQAKAYYFLGLLNQTQGNFTQAKEFYQKALKADPSSLEAFGKLTQLYALTGEEAKADTLFKTMSDLMPGNRELVQQMADYYARNGETGKAIDLLKELTAKYPGLLEQRQRLAELYAQTGKIEPAVEEYTSLLKLAPGQKEALSQYLQMLLNTNQMEKVKAVLEQVSGKWK